jgi:hypothetical protein
VSTPQIDEARLERINKRELRSGSHPAPPNGTVEACVMEAVAYVAGETWSDHPTCACPVLAAFMRAWNDGLPSDADRTRLLRPLIPKLVGSKSTPEVERRRADMAADWFIRVYTPTWLGMVDGLKPEAEKLRALAPLSDRASFEAAVPVVKEAQRSSAAAWDAAWDAASAAAWAAAWAAASAAARDAAWAAAWDAASAAASAAARDAASAAAKKKFEPITLDLQQSALELVDRMLAITPETLAA